MTTKNDDNSLDKLFEEATIKAANIKGKQFLQRLEQVQTFQVPISIVECKH